MGRAQNARESLQHALAEPQVPDTWLGIDAHTDLQQVLDVPVGRRGQDDSQPTPAASRRASFPQDKAQLPVERRGQ